MKTIRIIGTIFCFVLLCIMPIISAVEIKTIEKTQEGKANRQSESIFFNKIDDFIKKGTLPTHPLLFIVIVIQLIIRFSRGLFLEFISVAEIPEAPDVIIYPFLYFYSQWLMGTFIMEGEFWEKVSSSLGWNWPPFPF